MPPKQVRLKVPPKLREEKSDKDLAVQAILKALSVGEFDTHLDILFQAVDARIQESQGEPGDAVEPRDRVPTVKLTPGADYQLSGDKYAGVVVVYLEDVEPRDGDGGIRKVKVLCTDANSGGPIVPGKHYKLPAAALVPYVQDAKPAPHTPPYGYARGSCRKCGGPIAYNGRGRPPSVCDNCK